MHRIRLYIPLSLGNKIVLMYLSYDDKGLANYLALRWNDRMLVRMIEGAVGAVRVPDKRRDVCLIHIPQRALVLS